MKFEKKKYMIMTTDREKNVCAEEVDGYTFFVPVAGHLHEFATHRNESGNWEITDYLTGELAEGVRYATRREMAERAQSEEFVGRFEKFMEMHGHLYQAKTEMFGRIVNGEKLAFGDYKKAIEKRTGELVRAGKTAKAEGAGKSGRKAAKKETKAKDESTTESADAVTLESMRKWCAERENVVAMQRKGKGAVIRVEGETKRYRDELCGLGFKWSRKGFWWLKPAA